MKNIVVMPNFKQDPSKQEPLFLQECKRAWKHWCDLNDCEFFEIDQPVADFRQIPPQMQKMWTLDILMHNGVEFDQIAQVDHDTYPLPHCPNFFDKTNGEFAAVLDNGFGPTLNRSLQMVKTNWYPEATNVTWDTYFNSGFIVYSKKHLPVFQALQKFYETSKDEWCKVNRSPDLTDDQTLLNFELRKQGFDTTLLSRSYNVLDWHCRNFFANYVDELGREISSVKNIADCINIFHLTGDVDFRNQASSFLSNNFIK
jgi:hypothetical protein